MRTHPHRRPKRRMLGLLWLTQHLNGKPIRAIARDTQHTRVTVDKYIKEAIESLTENAQADVLKNLIPKAAELYLAALEQEIQNVKSGKPANLELADKLMKGMFVVNDPLGRKLTPQFEQPQGQLGDGDVEPQSLIGLVAARLPQQKKFPPKSKVIDVQQIKDGEEAGKDNRHDENGGDGPAQNRPVGS